MKPQGTIFRLRAIDWAATAVLRRIRREIDEVTGRHMRFPR